MMKNTNKTYESLESEDESVSSPRLYLNIKGGDGNLSPDAHLSSLSIQPIFRRGEEEETRGWWSSPNLNSEQADTNIVWVTKEFPWHSFLTKDSLSYFLLPIGDVWHQVI